MCIRDRYNYYRQERIVKLSNLECSILKELDRQNIKSDVISVVMNRLDTNDKKNDFLSFMIDNRNVLISLKDIFSELNLIAKQ